MKWDIRDDGGNRLLLVEGRMDATTSEDFGRAVAGLLENPGAVLVDLSGLEFISSAGLRSILTLAKTCRKEDRKLAFFALRPMVEDVFKISGFMSILKVFPDRAGALGGL
jgi:anti-anti-sigma factor